MPHVEGKHTEICDKGNGTSVEMIEWAREGQCVCMDPAPKFRVYLRGGVTIDVQGTSAHKGRKFALDILELLHDA